MIKLEKATVTDVIQENIDDLIAFDYDEPLAIINPPRRVSDEIMEVSVRADGDALDLMSSTWEEVNEIQADMCAAFAGRISHDDFFIKYEKNYKMAKIKVLDAFSDRIVEIHQHNQSEAELC